MIPPEEKAAPHKYYLYTPLNGTTFSGHSTKTTLGNTLRSIMYMTYYIYRSEHLGHDDTFWNNVWNTYPIQASGDDTVVYCKTERQAQSLASIIRSLCHEKKSNPDHWIARKGLGQCVPDIKIGTWDDQEFCSKWVVHSGTI